MAAAAGAAAGRADETVSGCLEGATSEVLQLKPIILSGEILTFSVTVARTTRSIACPWRILKSSQKRIGPGDLARTAWACRIGAPGAGGPRTTVYPGRRTSARRGHVAAEPAIIVIKSRRLMEPSELEIVRWAAQ